MAENDHAIIVGINRYPGIGDLEGPCNDAEAFRDWLISPEGGNVPADNVNVLLTTDFDQPEPPDPVTALPVADQIQALFTPFVINGAASNCGRRLYIFMAGHGFGDYAAMREVALFSANAQQLFYPHIVGTAYADWFRKNGTFEEVVLIMDCCRTMNSIQRVCTHPLPDTNMPGAMARVRAFYAFACMAENVTREKKTNGTVKGIFTEALIKALTSAPPNIQGRVTGQQVKNFVHNIIEEIAGEVPVGPPDINLDTNQDIVFVQRTEVKKHAVKVLLTPFGGGETLTIVNANFEVTTSIVCDAERVEIELAPGFYKASIEHSERNKLFEVTGDNVDITL